MRILRGRTVRELTVTRCPVSAEQCSPAPVGVAMEGTTGIETKELELSGQDELFFITQVFCVLGNSYELADQCPTREGKQIKTSYNSRSFPEI